MLLENKNAVLYGGGGTIGGAVARAFAREGAEPVPNYGGFQVSFGAVEAFRRTLARELGPKGIRVITLQTGGIPAGIPDERTRSAVEKSIAERTMLGRAATLADVGNTAVFAASDWSRALTGTKLKVTCGSVPD